nr:mediator of DNA damage checkpoint protein 1 [Lingulodinium polyedra]
MQQPPSWWSWLSGSVQRPDGDGAGCTSIASGRTPLTQPQLVHDPVAESPVATQLYWNEDVAWGAAFGMDSGAEELSATQSYTEGLFEDGGLLNRYESGLGSMEGRMSVASDVVRKVKRANTLEEGMEALLGDALASRADQECPTTNTSEQLVHAAVSGAGGAMPPPPPVLGNSNRSATLCTASATCVQHCSVVGEVPQAEPCNEQETQRDHDGDAGARSAATLPLRTPQRQASVSVTGTPQPLAEAGSSCARAAQHFTAGASHALLGSHCLDATQPYSGSASRHHAMGIDAAERWPRPCTPRRLMVLDTAGKLVAPAVRTPQQQVAMAARSGRTPASGGSAATEHYGGARSSLRTPQLGRPSNAGSAVSDGGSSGRTKRYDDDAAASTHNSEAEALDAYGSVPRLGMAGPQGGQSPAKDHFDDISPTQPMRLQPVGEAQGTAPTGSEDAEEELPATQAQDQWLGAGGRGVSVAGAGHWAAATASGCASPGHGRVAVAVSLERLFAGGAESRSGDTAQPGGHGLVAPHAAACAAEGGSVAAPVVSSGSGIVAAGACRRKAGKQNPRMPVPTLPPPPDTGTVYSLGGQTTKTGSKRLSDLHSKRLNGMLRRRSQSTPRPKDDCDFDEACKALWVGQAPQGPTAPGTPLLWQLLAAKDEEEPVDVDAESPHCLGSPTGQGREVLAKNEVEATPVNAGRPIAECSSLWAKPVPTFSGVRDTVVALNAGSHEQQRLSACQAAADAAPGRSASAARDGPGPALAPTWHQDDCPVPEAVATLAPSPMASSELATAQELAATCAPTPTHVRALATTPGPMRVAELTPLSTATAASMTPVPGPAMVFAAEPSSLPHKRRAIATSPDVQSQEATAPQAAFAVQAPLPSLSPARAAVRSPRRQDECLSLGEVVASGRAPALASASTRGRSGAAEWSPSAAADAQHCDLLPKAECRSPLWAVPSWRRGHPSSRPPEPLHAASPVTPGPSQAAAEGLAAARPGMPARQSPPVPDIANDVPTPCRAAWQGVSPQTVPTHPCAATAAEAAVAKRQASKAAVVCHVPRPLLRCSSGSPPPAMGTASPTASAASVSSDEALDGSVHLGAALGGFQSLGSEQQSLQPAHRMHALDGKRASAPPRGTTACRQVTAPQPIEQELVGAVAAQKGEPAASARGGVGQLSEGNAAESESDSDIAVDMHRPASATVSGQLFVSVHQRSTSNVMARHKSRSTTLQPAVPEDEAASGSFMCGPDARPMAASPACAEEQSDTSHVADPADSNDHPQNSEHCQTSHGSSPSGGPPSAGVGIQNDGATEIGEDEPATLPDECAGQPPQLSSPVSHAPPAGSPKLDNCGISEDSGMESEGKSDVHSAVERNKPWHTPVAGRTPQNAALGTYSEGQASAGGRRRAEGSLANGRISIALALEVDGLVARQRQDNDAVPGLGESECGPERQLEACRCWEGQALRASQQHEAVPEVGAGIMVPGSPEDRATSQARAKEQDGAESCGPLLATAGVEVPLGLHCEAVASGQEPDGSDSDVPLVVLARRRAGSAAQAATSRVPSTASVVPAEECKGVVGEPVARPAECDGADRLQLQAASPECPRSRGHDAEQPPDAPDSEGETVTLLHSGASGRRTAPAVKRSRPEESIAAADCGSHAQSSSRRSRGSSWQRPLPANLGGPPALDVVPGATLGLPACSSAPQVPPTPRSWLATAGTPGKQQPVSAAGDSSPEPARAAGLAAAGARAEAPQPDALLLPRAARAPAARAGGGRPRVRGEEPGAGDVEQGGVLDDLMRRPAESIAEEVLALLPQPPSAARPGPPAAAPSKRRRWAASAPPRPGSKDVRGRGGWPSQAKRIRASVAAGTWEEPEAKRQCVVAGVQAAGESACPMSRQAAAHEADIDSPKTPDALTVATAGSPCRDSKSGPEPEPEEPEHEPPRDRSVSKREVSVKVESQGLACGGNGGGSGVPLNSSGHMCFATTGLELSVRQRRILLDIGAEVAEEWTTEITHLIADTFRRTTKMMCAICRGMRIVTPDYIAACRVAGRRVDEKPFLLQDAVCEAAFARKRGIARGYSLTAALERARRRGPMLKGVSVYCFPSVIEKRELPLLVSAAGGTWLNRFPPAPDDDSVLLLAERTVSSDREQQRRKAHEVYDVELLREAACTQELRRAAYRLR